MKYKINNIVFLKEDKTIRKVIDVMPLFIDIMDGLPKTEWRNSYLLDPPYYEANITTAFSMYVPEKMLRKATRLERFLFYMGATK